MSNPNRGSGNLVKWLVIIAAVGGFGLCILGILAAIAIPAFMKYIKRSKASEAQAITSRLADEAVAHYADSCEWPAALPRHTNPETCCGGEKCTADTEALDVWGRAALTAPREPTYFAYSTRKLDQQTYEIIAEADFTCGGNMHTVTIQVEATGECDARTSPTVVTNEFE
ncbi:MAG: type IV pilin protein [Myxococcota bacterium]